VLIKVCGLTREEDAALAVELGAGSLGFVFWPDSPRAITVDRARHIIRQLPPFVTPVGIFVNETVDVINAAADRAGLGAVQLHGDEPVEVARRVHRPVLKAVHAAVAHQAAAEWPERMMLLLDAYDPRLRGGTGRTVDWMVAASVAARRRVMLAGGLHADNVAEAIDRVRPFGIDVSSGVESAPGVKDHMRMRSFFEAIERAGAGS
jgi:phosphoribosylanthranilate isomerase